MGYRDISVKRSRSMYGIRKRQHVGIKAYVEPVVVITGTLVSGSTEAQVATGSRTLIMTLNGGLKWAPSGSVFNAARQAIINGITSAQAEATGWNTVVRDVAAVTTVVRTSDTVVTFTSPAAATYDITADEIVTVTIPAAAFEFDRRQNVRPTATFTIPAT